MTQISLSLQDVDFTRWSPPGPDLAVVEMVKPPEPPPETLEIKKRYGAKQLDIQTEATVEIEAKVTVVDFGYDGELEYREFAAE